MRPIGVLLLCLLALPAHAQEQLFAVQAPPGTYVLVVAADGSVTMSALQIVRPTGTPITPTDPTPTDPKLAALYASLRAIPVIAPSTETLTMATLYRQVAGLQVTSADSLKIAVNALFEPVAAQTADPAAWKAWKGKVDAAVAAAGISTYAEYVAAYKLIADYVK